MVISHDMFQSQRLFIRCAVVHHGKLMKSMPRSADDEVVPLKHVMRDNHTNSSGSEFE